MSMLIKKHLDNEKNGVNGSKNKIFSTDSDEEEAQNQIEIEKDEINMISPQVVSLFGVIIQESVSVDLKIPTDQETNNYVTQYG